MLAGLEDLSQLSGIRLESAPVIRVVERENALVHHDVGFPDQNYSRHSQVMITEVVDQPAAQEKGVRAFAPLVVVADEKQGVLHFRKTKVLPDLRSIEVLNDVTRLEILVLGLRKEGVLWRQLKLHFAIPFEAAQVCVRVKSFDAEILGVERVAQAAQRAELRRGLAQVAVAQDLGDAA